MNPDRETKTDRESIAVYLPTHNRVALLARALKSVLNQTLPASEIIVVDDCSSDTTKEFMQEFCSAHPQCKYLRNDVPKGACIARNRAIEVASTKFITGMDDDDELLPNHLESLRAAFSEERSCVVSSIIQDTGSSRILRNLDVGVISLNQMLHYNKLGNQVFTLTERLRAVNGFDEQFPAFQDYDTWVRLIECFGPAEKIRSASYVWHTGHEQNRISHSPERRLRALELFKQKHSHLLSRKHLDSLEIMRIRMTGEALPFWTMLSLINMGNWKASVALYLNTNFAGLKQKIDLLRHSR